MASVLYPGSFDPPTNGHVDVIERLVKLFDRVVIAVVGNPSKSAMFTPEERMGLLTEIAPAGVEVVAHQGLVVDLATETGVDVMVKGLRGIEDYETEDRMAQMNRSLTGIETLFLPTSPSWAFVASSLVREITRLGGDVSHLVPAPVLRALEERT